MKWDEQSAAGSIVLNHISFAIHVKQMKTCCNQYKNAIKKALSVQISLKA